MQKHKQNKGKKLSKRIHVSRGGLIDKGAVYVVVIMTILSFGAYAMVGSTHPAKPPPPNNNLIEPHPSVSHSSNTGLQLRTFTPPTAPPTSPKQPLPSLCTPMPVPITPPPGVTIPPHGTCQP